ncbi:Acetyltransferase (GNAT) family [Musa troglodytarum]|uniref:Acetyltransferase (GNAT) family n=1 Tax=Musa troglodytarum TaxID=320322 RepID=A0A9E7JA94_9LILI|nr:Acetyltransferase (GNAT) family [Musa troglodytarum]
MEREASVVVVREYNAATDRAAAEEVERTCELGSSGKMSLHTDLLGDPASRIRHSSTYLMLVLFLLLRLVSPPGDEWSAQVAETCGGVKEIVGLVRGCVKVVTCGKKLPRQGGSTKNICQVATPTYTKVGYLLGLRVSPSHRYCSLSLSPPPCIDDNNDRRKGIGLRLVRQMEGWFREKGAEYAYMATGKDNEASMRLFTERCDYTKFRAPTILVHPVFAHHLPVPRSVTVLRLGHADAEAIYRRCFATTEFFPRDIDAVLRNPLTVATFLAVPAGCSAARQWPGAEAFLAAPPGSWAVASAWDCGGVLRMEVRGASRLRRWAAAATRAADRAMPWLRIPAVPDLFRPFVAWFLYGVGAEGPGAAEMAAAAWREAHNVARGSATVLAAEVAAGDSVLRGIPRWRWLSCAEDVWCVKRLGEEYSDGGVGDWTKSGPGSSIFVDPREL